MVSGGSPRTWRPKAAEAAIKALQIDPDLAEAHATLGYVRHYNWEWEEAERSFQRAIAAQPEQCAGSNLVRELPVLAAAIRRGDSGGADCPRSGPAVAHREPNVGWVFYRARRNDEAIAEFKRGLKLDPTYVQAHMRLAAAYGTAARHDEAMAERETVVRLTPGSLGNVVALEHAKMLAGRANEFRQRVAESIASLPQRYVPPSAIANPLFNTGRIDEGFEWLQRAYEERTNNMVYLGVEPDYDVVRDDNRFKALMRAVGLP